MLLQIAGLPASTYHYWRARFDDPTFPQVDARAVAAVAKFDDEKGRYGYRRIRLLLQDDGIFLSRKTVYRLLKRHNRSCRIRARRYNSYRGSIGVVAPNLVQRCFHRNRPNQLWVTDVTEFKVAGRKVYLSAIMDTFNNEIVGYSTAVSPTVSFVTRSLKQALASRLIPAGMIIHSDQGFQYQHRTWRNILAQAGCKQSMSRKGNCYDNAPIESFFGHMKDEMHMTTTYTSVPELIQAIDDHIRWYNYERIQEKLGGMTPKQFRVTHTEFHPACYPALVA